jgi:hypothetical protein
MFCLDNVQVNYHQANALAHGLTQDGQIGLKLRHFRELTRACFPKVTHLACNQACD